MLYRSLWYCLLLAFPLFAYPQSEHLTFEHLGTTQGLSNSNVICTLQDSRGFMWFGTREGLNKYDGYTFTVYRNNALDNKSLANNLVNDMVEDTKGYLWIGTWGGGLDRYDRRTNQFTHYRHEPANPVSLSSNLVTALLLDSRGILWVGTEDGGVNQMDSTGGFVHYVHDPGNSTSLGGNYVRDLVEDADHHIWVATMNGGLNLFDRWSRTFRRYLHNPGDAGSINNNETNCVFEDSHRRLWVGTFSGLDLLDRHTGIFTHYRKDGPVEEGITNNAINSLAEDGEGNLWIGTENDGLGILDGVTGKFQHYYHDDIDPSSIGTNSLYAIYRDSKKNMWIGSFNGGINFVNRDARKFILYRHNSSSYSLSDNHVLCIYEDLHDNLWIGTDGGGLNLFDRVSGRFTHYRHIRENPKSIGGDYVLKVMEDDKENLWIGTWADGITVLNRKTNSYTHYRHNPADPGSLGNNNAWTIYEDREHRIWVGTYGEGLDLYDPVHRSFIHHRHQDNDPGSLGNNKIHCIWEDKKGRLWIGTDGGGLDLFDRTSGRFTHYRHEEGKNSLCSNYVNGICEDRMGCLWITTTEGLSRYELENGRFTNYTTREGLPDDVVFGVLEDALGNLWISTNKGLSRLDAISHRFKNFGVADGLQANEFKEQAFCKSRSGVLYFGGINGFNEIVPGRIRSEAFDPPLVLTNFLVFNREVPIGAKGDNESPLHMAIGETEQIVLPYKSSVISFLFASLNYTDKDKKKYAYRLEGFDKGWNYVGTERSVTYTNLDPGRYTFKIKGLDNDGEWSGKILSLVLQITPAFWMTWWFRTLLILAILGSVFAFYRVRISTMNSLTRELERQVQERTERLSSLTLEERKARQEAEQASKAKSIFLATMSHEIRTPMNGVIGMATLMAETDLTAQQQTYNATILSCGESLLNVINDILDYSKIDSGKMEIEQQDFDLPSCIQAALGLFQEKAQQSGLQLVYRIDPDVPPHIVGDALRLRQVLVNLISNAVKFTHHGEIFLGAHLLRRENNGMIELAFEVRDTGIGIPPDKIDMLFKSFSQVDSSTTRKYGGTGLGLAICERLVALMGGRISVRSEIGLGTTFTFTIRTRAGHVPVGPVQEETAVKTTTMKPGFAREFPLRILIAEDNLINQQLISHILGNMGYEPDSVENGQMAVSAVAERSYDLVLMDVQMPEMDGLEATKVIRQSPSHQPVIIALTANAMKGDREECLLAGMDDYISKPVRLEELTGILQKWSKQVHNGSLS